MRAIACRCPDDACPICAVLIECLDPDEVLDAAPFLCPGCSETLDVLGHYELAGLVPVGSQAVA